MSNALIAITPYGPLGASSRVRVFDWLQHLGVCAQVWSYVGTRDHSLRALARRAPQVLAAERNLRSATARVRSKKVLISRVASPFSRGEVESRLLRSAAWGVYDFDDALWASQAARARFIFPKSKIWASSVRAADVVIAGSGYLAERAAALNSNVVVIPSCVEPADYRVKESYQLSEIPTLVWMGSRSTEKHLSSIEGALLELHRRRGVRLQLIGAPSGTLGALDAMTTRLAWTRDDFARHLVSGDVGIAPLQDDEFARGKCAYKILQYGAAGLPVVGSPVGASTSALADLQGLAPGGEGQWVSAVEQLLDEGVEQRNFRGRTARQAVIDRYSYAAWSRAWVDSVGVVSGKSVITCRDCK